MVSPPRVDELRESRRGRQVLIHMYQIYWLINEFKTKTYIGFTDDINKRIIKHKNNQVKTTQNFGKFRVFILENIDNLFLARQREKYWKSSAGRKKLKIDFEKI